MIRPADLISPSYKDTQASMHASRKPYGDKAYKWASTVADVIRKYKASSVLDYGCGKGTLARQLRSMGIPGLRVDQYDPAIPGLDKLPDFADLVTCTDVLEHIEPDRLDTVLAHIKTLARKAAFVVISTRPAKNLLPDGSNAHLIIEDADWWLGRLRAAEFTVQILTSVPQKELVVVLA